MAKEHDVILYQTASCPWCHKAAEFLEEHNIKFKAIDVGEDSKAGEEMVEKSGQRGVPVIVVDGKVIVGFDEATLKKALEIE